jgi:hypothetical protein
MRLLLSLLMFGFAIDFLSSFVFYRTGFDAWLGHFYVLGEITIVMSIIAFWQEAQNSKRFFRILMGLYIVFWFYAKFSFESLNGPYYLTGSISSVILALSSGYTLFIVIADRVQPLFNNYRFWVLLSFVIYYICVLLPIALQSILLSHSTSALILAWSITWVAAILSNLLFAKGFLCPQTQA